MRDGDFQVLIWILEDVSDVGGTSGCSCEGYVHTPLEVFVSIKSEEACKSLSSSNSINISF